MQNKLVHATERKAFQTILTSLINKAQTKDASEIANSLINLMEKILGDSWTQESYATLRDIAANPDSKWVHYANRIAREMDSGIVTSFLLNAAYEGGFRGYKTTVEASKEHGCNIPWIVLMDPTSACNMHCTTAGRRSMATSKTYPMRSWTRCSPRARNWDCTPACSPAASR